MYRVGDVVSGNDGRRVRLLGAGLALRSVRQAASLLKEHWNVDCEVWSCPSYTRLARDAGSGRRWNRFHPLKTLGPGTCVIASAKGTTPWWRSPVIRRPWPSNCVNMSPDGLLPWEPIPLRRKVSLQSAPSGLSFRP